MTLSYRLSSSSSTADLVPANHGLWVRDHEHFTVWLGRIEIGLPLCNPLRHHCLRHADNVHTDVLCSQPGVSVGL
jgi:hypothetical protein